MTWRTEAACWKSYNPDFFPGVGDASLSHSARLICISCPVIRECAEWATSNNQEHGIWGNTNHRERQALRRAARA